MKTSRLISAVAIAALTIAMANGQSGSSTTTTTTTTYVPTTTVVGARVMGTQGEEIGQITDVVLDKQTGCMAYVVLSTTEPGGTRKTVAAPWAVFSPGADTRTYTVRVDKQKIYSAPVWESTRIEEYSRADWVNNVYSYYGVQPQVGVNVQTNFGAQGEQRREREQTNIQRSGATETAPTPNRDMRVRPERTPHGRPGAGASASPSGAASGAQESAPATSPSESRPGRMHERPSASPSEGAATTPEESAAERNRRRERRGTEETGASATPEAGRPHHGASRESNANAPEGGTTANPNATGTNETAATPHHGGKRARGAQPSPEASPTP